MQIYRLGFIGLMIQTYLYSYLKTDVNISVLKQSNTCLNDYTSFYKITSVWAIVDKYLSVQRYK